MLEIPKQPDLAYTEEGHAYTWKGKIVPSITKILSDVGISPDFGMVNQDILNAAAIRGTNVHSLCQFYDEDDLGEVDESYRGYLDAWIQFRKDYGFVPDFIETMLYHTKHGYAGRPDRSGIINGKRAMVEIKTGEGKQLHKSIGVQLAAQAMLLRDIAKAGPVKTRIAVKLHKDGTYTAKEFKNRSDGEIFLAACAIVNWKRTRVKREKK